MSLSSPAVDDIIVCKAAGGTALPIAAIIVSYNRRDDLRRCLQSLAGQCPAIARTIVVDNGSSDGTAAMLREAFPWVDLIPAGENWGPCVARNLGALRAPEPILWFLDSDTEIIGHDGAARLHALFAAPDVVAVGGEALLDGSGHIVGVKRVGLRANGNVQGDLIFSGTAECAVIASCNLMLRKAAFLATGGFDPYYFFFYEDMDVTWRLHQRGHRQLALAPMPVVHHFSEKVRIRRVWLEARNRMYFCLKNMPWSQVLLLPAHDLAFIFRPENFGRLLRRAAKPVAAKSLVTITEQGGKRDRVGQLRRIAVLAFGMAAKLVLTYVALPVVLRPALKARRDRQPLSATALPAGLRGWLTAPALQA